VNAHGALIQTRFFDEGEFRPENIEAKINNRTKAIIVNTPENPTGRVFAKKQLEEIVDLAERRNLFLISDEVYEKIVFGGASHYSLAAMAPERTFLINSCSKTYAMTGWRIGWVTGPKEYMDAMMKINRALIACPSSISQIAALSALTGPQDCVEVMRKAYEMRMEYTVPRLETMGLNFEVPKGTFYLFPDIQRDPWQFALSLLENKQVSVVPGDAFGSAGKTSVRIALTVPLDMLKDGLNRFEEHLSDER
jgi:aspartate/methionine/tyrosine aminotransferase